jgi:hypothetical protein
MAKDIFISYRRHDATGRDFAVVTLTPDQAVRVPLGGTFGGAVQPWMCHRDGLPPTQ